MKDEEIPGLGMARVKQEGAPLHPDDLIWEHPPGSGCQKCKDKYDRQLKAWKDWQKGASSGNS